MGIADVEKVQISTGRSPGDSTPPAPLTALRVPCTDGATHRREHEAFQR